ncbi:acyl coA binding protein domain-containing protein [Ditylenchus destructor]|uniref:Acyl coA binding protein domain-containing protein n=1 Tax=Ditylenchus destructor TaxID=166010 RepID=A0AAD4MUH8_9BILA|nr:acyl coA binding protein domain-containing protein [Ditylenchus destructor]
MDPSKLDPNKLPPHLKAKWDQWQAEEKALREKVEKELEEYEKRRQEERDVRRDRDFADAVDKVSRAGYVGKHGTFTVPSHEKIKMNAWRKQAQYGDYDETKDIQPTKTLNEWKCVQLWASLKGINSVDAKRQFIRFANELITEYGWNPPPGWT